MPDTPNTDTSQIQGLPAGATLKPIQSAAPTGEIQGLPPGATLKPIGSASAQTAPPPSNYDPVAGMFSNNSVLVDAAKGFGKGVLDTTSGIGELIHKIPVVGPAIIPAEGLAAEEKIAGADTIGEHIGKGMEDIAEFASGNELLEGITRVAKLEQLAKSSPIIARMIEKTPELFKKIASGATKGATVGGAQGAVKGAAEGDAIGGAEGGAAGGAIGGAIAETLSAGAKPIANKMGIATSAEEDIMRAAKPGKRNGRFLADWDIAKERYAKEMDANGKYEDLNDAAERMRDQRQELWKTEVAPKIAKHANEDVFPNLTLPTANAPGAVNPKNNPISDAVRAKVTPAMNRLSPKSAKAIETIAKRFDGPMKVQELEENVEHLNAELTTEGFYKMSASERAAAVKANPSLAAKSAAVEASRDQLYSHLEKNGEPDIQELKRTYGAMRNVENEVRGQVNVASRQNPISLKQIIAIASGHPVGIAATLADKIYNEPAAILNRAVGKNIPDGAVKSAAKDLARGAGTAIKESIPAVGAAAGRIAFTASDGRKYQVPASAWEKVQQADPGAKQIQ